MAVPDYAKLSKFEDINYLCNIRDEKDFNVKFVRDKGVIILRNCFTEGKLIKSILQWVLASWLYKLNSERCLKFLEPLSCFGEIKIRIVNIVSRLKHS